MRSPSSIRIKTTVFLVILDIMLPGMDGYSVLEKVRAVSNVPVLMLTAKDQEEDKVTGLQNGADDYLTKPFGLAELTARVNSLVRRYTKFNPHHEENQRLRVSRYDHRPVGAFSGSKGKAGISDRQRI